MLPPTRAPSFPLLNEDSFARQVENSLEKIRDILNDNKVSEREYNVYILIGCLPSRWRQAELLFKH